jgi:uncharacterized protein
MTPQERELILAVAQRLRRTPLTEKDHEAERLIHTDIGSQPDALYLLTQTVIVQEQGLRHAQERIHELEARLQAAQQPRPGGFLSSLFGAGSTAYGSGSPPSPPPPYAASSAPGGSAAGSFLRSAAATAAGVVGGQLIYDGLRHMFGSSVFAPGTVSGSLASPPVVTNIFEQSDPGEYRSSITGGGSWEENDNSSDDSMDDDDNLAGGGDFDTESEDGGDYDNTDSF